MRAGSKALPDPAPLPPLADEPADAPDPAVAPDVPPEPLPPAAGSRPFAWVEDPSLVHPMASASEHALVITWCR
jgi:hypothetical protein